jgi:hypothetical protein
MRESAVAQEDLERKVIELAAQHLILRDYVAWLLGREAGNSSDPHSVVRLASEFADFRIDSRVPQTDADLQFCEILRKEKDWIVAAASKVLGD